MRAEQDEKVRLDFFGKWGFVQLVPLQGRRSCLDSDFSGLLRMCLSLMQASLFSRLLGKCLLEIACSVPGTPGSQGVVEILRPGTRGRLE